MQIEKYKKKHVGAWNVKRATAILILPTSRCRKLCFWETFTGAASGGQDINRAALEIYGYQVRFCLWTSDYRCVNADYTHVKSVETKVLVWDLVTSSSDVMSWESSIEIEVTHRGRDRRLSSRRSSTDDLKVAAAWSPLS